MQDIKDPGCFADFAGHGRKFGLLLGITLPTRC